MCRVLCNRYSLHTQHIRWRCHTSSRLYIKFLNANFQTHRTSHNDVFRSPNYFWFFFFLLLSTGTKCFFLCLIFFLVCHSPFIRWDIPYEQQNETSSDQSHTYHSNQSFNLSWRTNLVRASCAVFSIYIPFALTLLLLCIQ